MDQTKSFLLSKTIIGIAVMLATHFYGADIGQLAGLGVQTAQEIATGGFTAAAVLAVVGRLVAKQGISLLPKQRKKPPDKRGGPVLTPKPIPADYPVKSQPDASKPPRAKKRE